MLKETIEHFVVEARSSEQQEDAGHYFIVKMGNTDVGIPFGPYLTSKMSDDAAQAVLAV